MSGSPLVFRPLFDISAKQLESFLYLEIDLPKTIYHVMYIATCLVWNATADSNVVSAGCLLATWN